MAQGLGTTTVDGAPGSCLSRKHRAWSVLVNDDMFRCSKEGPLLVAGVCFTLPHDNASGT